MKYRELTPSEIEAYNVGYKVGNRQIVITDIEWESENEHKIYRKGYMAGLMDYKRKVSNVDNVSSVSKVSNVEITTPTTSITSTTPIGISISKGISISNEEIGGVGERETPKKRFTVQSEFYVDGQYFDEFPVEALPLLKKHWSSRELERIRKDLACKPAHNTTVERLLQEYPSDILPYKLLGEKKSIPLTKKQWEWFQEQSITPAVKVKAIDILENYALSHPDKFKKFTDPSLIMGRKSGWAYVEAFKEPYRFENQEELIAELKRVGLR